MNKTYKTIISRALPKLKYMGIYKLILAFILLWLLVYLKALDLSNLTKLSEKPILVAIGMCAILFTVLIGNFRWQILLKSQKINESFLRLLQINFISLFSKLFLPGAVGSEIIRALYIGRITPGKRTGALLSLIMDRYCGLLGLLSVTLGVILIRHELISQNTIFLSLSAIVVTLLLSGIGLLIVGLWASKWLLDIEWLTLKNHPGVFRKTLIQIITSISVYKDNPGSVLFAYLLSIPIHLLLVGTIIICAHILAPNILSNLEYAIAATFSIFANAAPITPGGLGVGEGAFDIMCQLLINNSNHVFAFGSIFLSYRAISVIISLPGILAYVNFRAEIRDNPPHT